MRRFGSIGLAVCATAVLALAPDARADDPPTGAVTSSWHSPAGNPPLDSSGTPTPPGTPEDMPFTVTAQSAQGGANLAQATLTMGAYSVSADLCAPAGSCRSGTARLPFNTKDFADGTYDLRIVVTDVDGNVGSVVDDPGFQVWNYRPTGSKTATLSVGSSVPTPAGGGGGGPSGGVKGASAGSCTSPKLSMVLDQRPLRIRHGVPVLVAGKRYRFTGRLTCVINGRRVSAPKRTRIDVRALVRGRSAPKAHGSVGAKGKIVFRIASPSSRTLEFRFTAPNGKVTRVRIKIDTVKVKKQKHKKG
jgi:hypothetical protein